ncbi:MAG: hypothetical protein HC825_07575, partial [Oscillatoriales cyanobacterium RM1_1_9]|nr:hypothetical protein [Oscillatoriales cyanobacterium RM1_1_9]
GQKLFILGAKRLPEARPYIGRVPGRVIEVQAGIGTQVLTGDGVLLLTQVQPEGGEAAPPPKSSTPNPYN